MKKRLAIMGATGSIGVQTLEVVDRFPDELEVEVLTAHDNIALLTLQAKKYKPKFAITSNEKNFAELKANLEGEDITVMAGEDAIRDIVSIDEIDVVVAAITGIAGLPSTYEAVVHGKTIALANKETLVVAGDLIMAKAKETGAQIVPVDSEHSAIFQCLQGESHPSIEKLILTASGGPFRTTSYEELKKVTKEQALNHPNWNMGPKVTVDSATLMNKGLEMIEARWLFDIDPENIDVIIHPQSIVHSFVQFIDGSMKAQAGLPDMKLPIQYALMYPERASNDFKRFDFADYPEWTFEKPRIDDFKALWIAEDAMKKGGTYPAVLNAANEVAVAKFLDDKIGFTEIPYLIEHTVTNYNPTHALSIEEYLETDKEARKIALEF